MSLRARLALVVGLVLVAAIAVTGIIAIRTTRATLVQQIDEQVRVAAVRLESNYDNPSSSQTPDGGEPVTRFQPIARYVYDREGKLLLAQPYGFTDAPRPAPVIGDGSPASLLRAVNVLQTVPAAEGDLDYRALVQLDDNGNFVLTAVPTTAANEAVEDLVGTMVIAALVAVVLAGLASWWAIAQELRPIDRIIGTASAIGEVNLGRRLPEPGAGTELGRLSRALNRMLDRIEEASRLQKRSEATLRRFIADAAHELRTPLTSLRGYAELYRQGSLDSPERIGQAMARIEDEGIRMGRLLDDMMLLARLDEPRDRPLANVDLSHIVRDEVAGFRDAEPDRQVSVEINDDIGVEGESGQLSMLVTAMLANVRTHTPATAGVNVTLTRVDGMADLRVRDMGPGIGLAFQAHAFERFTREDPARTRATGGTGLGLAIAEAVTTAHGGTIQLESAPGHGATFIVRLPIAAGGGAN